MAPSQTIPELVAAAQANVKPSQDRISEIRADLQGRTPTAAETHDLHAARVAIEGLAVDIFTLFEARMQHHFKRGPFSRKLQNALIAAGQSGLAEHVHHYYLMINVLKHGKGASHRELLAGQGSVFVLAPSEDTTIASSGNDQAPSAFIDVSQQGFFEGLSATISDAYQFLEG